jgi:broad specificity phosphatase PhoE
MGQMFVVRHGQASLLTSDYDRLSDIGRGQARRLGEYWSARGERFDAVFTGPALRQRDTAKLVGEVMVEGGHTWPTPEVLPELDEHDAFGLLVQAQPHLQGDAEITPLAEAFAGAAGRANRSRAFQVLFEAVMTRWLGRGLEPEGIETWPDFRTRVERGVQHIIDSAAGGARIAAFSSVGPVAVMLARALQCSDVRSFETAWRLRNASITRFVFGGDRFTLDGYNAIGHLPAPQMQTFR